LEARQVSFCKASATRQEPGSGKPSGHAHGSRAAAAAEPHLANSAVVGLQAAARARTRSATAGNMPGKKRIHDGGPVRLFMG